MKMTTTAAILALTVTLGACSGDAATQTVETAATVATTDPTA